MKYQHRHTPKHVRANMSHRTVVSVLLAGIAIVGFVFGLGLTIGIASLVHNQPPLGLDITYINPREAVVFWQSEQPGIGYIQYGESPHKRLIKVEQTSSVPSTIHTVLLDDLPLQPIYASFHTDSDPWYKRPYVVELSYESTPYQ